MIIWATGYFIREISFEQPKATDYAHKGHVPKWEMSKSLLQLLQVIYTSLDSSSDLSDCACIHIM